ncbi:hypothetical protein BJ684DRAFT_21934 [Piptocephalis cylindrospora]|uniref:ATP-dependent helicase CHD1-2/hrp3 HTH domain-containing protein n=1 Tax=Piptocephalis cylindrospora TaxID=1907219 RepID=A0A4P9Y0D9_9FUNG|nr:hypothetical protein BJ684DRAFT_21934 [Piptocephalis cylindrospora]|eukprot:RKP11491.1 hypothetical protein BJ684DRAFT_21934 [Piptocephalis cylindrospora]
MTTEHSSTSTQRALKTAQTNSKADAHWSGKPYQSLAKGILKYGVGAWGAMRLDEELGLDVFSTVDLYHQFRLAYPKEFDRYRDRLLSQGMEDMEPEEERELKDSIHATASSLIPPLPSQSMWWYSTPNRTTSSSSPQSPAHSILHSPLSGSKSPAARTVRCFTEREDRVIREGVRMVRSPSSRACVSS